MAKEKTQQDTSEAGDLPEKVEEAEQKGLWGNEVDTTPNENYTVAGVTSGAPVPESSSDPVKARREAASDD